jgi:hypothetical protein
VLINTRNTYVIVLEAGGFKVKVLSDAVSDEGLLPISYKTTFSLCPHMMEEAWELSGGVFY